jgi:hypothetical protein
MEGRYSFTDCFFGSEQRITRLLPIAGGKLKIKLLVGEYT